MLYKHPCKWSASIGNPFSIYLYFTIPLHNPPEIRKNYNCKQGGMMMDKKTKEGMKNLEVKATPEDLATEKRMSDNKSQHRTPKI
jgi:hypothetical protein